MKQPTRWHILRPYKFSIVLLVAFIFGTNGLNLVIPKIIAQGIDAYSAGTLNLTSVSITFTLFSLGVLILAYLQGIVQAYLSERAARDIRNKLVAKISDLTYAMVEKETPGKLLTNLTSDIDAIKLFVSNAVMLIISSIFLIIGASLLLILSNWKLALAVLAILPLIGLVFFAVFKRMRPLFMKTQDVVDRLNKVINESILGAALIRVLHSAKAEDAKFSVLNTEAKENGMGILKLFSFIIPTVGIIANLASLVILALGGYFVISGSMTLGNFTAFNSYVFILIFPIIILGFVSNIVSRAQVSYDRISEVLNLAIEPERGTTTKNLSGHLEVRHLTLMHGEKATLKDISFKVKAGSRIAIIGPTAAGKTQLLYSLIGLIQPDKGEVLYDGTPLNGFDRKSLHDQVGLVFQESVVFNMSLRENIGFSLAAREEDITKAIEAAELGDFVKGLAKGLDTIVSERGTNLSGGQKQRIMLARALALNPRVLLLDDFTARVDAATEKKILKNIEKMYPETTIISVTQKIASIEHFDQIILLMEGEMLAHGTHEELMASSPEYMVILESQKSTNTYELRT